MQKANKICLRCAWNRTTSCGFSVFVADVFWTHLNLHFSFYGATAEDGLCMDWISIRNTQLVFLHIYFDMYTAPPNPFWFLFCFVDLSSCLPNCLDIRSWTVSGTASVRNCRCEQTTLSFVCQWELVMVSRLITLSFLHNEWITWPTHQSVSQPDDLGWWPIRKQWRIFHIICVQFLDALNLCCLGSMWIYAFLLRFLLFFKRGRAGLVIKFSINSSIL